MANLITLSRIPLLVVVVLMLYLGDATVRMIAVPLLFLLMLLDTVDGIVARASGTDSLLGSVLDIAADRIYELVLWVVFTDLGLIPIVIPITVIIRTTLTDALRSIGVGSGVRPFEQHRSRIGRFLVGSPIMRGGYGTSKVIAFTTLALALALRSFPEGGRAATLAPNTLSIAIVISWIAVVLCVVRGLPVIVGSARRHMGGESPHGG